MKKIIVSLLLIIIVSATQAQFTKASLQASGLTCAMCSKAVYKALSAIPFVSSVKSDIEASLYEISFKPGAHVEPDDLSRAVVNAGFSVSQLKLTGKFTPVKIQDDSHIQYNDQSYHFIHVGQKNLEGEQTITLIDKNFITASAYKKYSKLTQLSCYPSGMMNGKRVYHATL